MSSASCPNKNCTEMIFLAENTKLPFECEKCKQTITAKHRETYSEVMNLTKLHLDQMKMSRVACKRILCSICILETSFGFENFIFRFGCLQCAN